MSKRRVLLCSMDGVRPDALHAAPTPVIHRLARGGAAAWNARTVMPSCTLPCHTSMLRGVPPERHGITTNTFQPLVRPVPSLIDVAKDAGLTTGFFYNWEELRDLAAPGKLDVAVMTANCHTAAGDRHIADATVRYLEEVDFDLLFVYFGWPDECAHKYGWMSAEYLDAIANADASLGTILEALARLDRLEETTTLVLSDHGGHERTHGTEMDEDMTIPWVLHGPGVRADYEINAPVFIYDTPSTLAHALSIQPSPKWDGRVVREALA